MDTIGRKQLPHDPPLSIGTGDHVYFVTICAKERNEKPLLRSGVPERLLEAAKFRHEQNIWRIRIFLIMPDHVHALLYIPPEGSLRRPLAAWKRWTATKGGFAWQRDFFDHRLRAEESEREKADYILRNPVRAGLVDRPEDWPHWWISGD